MRIQLQSLSIGLLRSIIVAVFGVNQSQGVQSIFVLRDVVFQLL